MASQELGKLGQSQGPPVLYTWTPPSLMPLFLPWLGVLALLLLPVNRTGQAWWIWPALAAAQAVAVGVQALLTAVPSEPREIISEGISALGFGLAAVWLVVPMLMHRSRFRTLLRLVLTLEAASLAAYLVRQDWGGDWWQGVAMAVPVGVGALALAIAFGLTGWSVHTARGRGWTWAWLLAWLTVGWLGIVMALLFVASFQGQGSAPWNELMRMAVAAALLCFGIAVPYLALSGGQPFFRRRLAELMHRAGGTEPRPGGEVEGRVAHAAP